VSAIRHLVAVGARHPDLIEFGSFFVAYSKP
jgi:hypothetical protein